MQHIDLTPGQHVAWVRDGEIETAVVDAAVLLLRDEDRFVGTWDHEPTVDEVKAVL